MTFAHRCQASAYGVRYAAIMKSRPTTPAKPQAQPEKRKPPRPPRHCCQSGCYGCEWAEAMRELGEL